MVLYNEKAGLPLYVSQLLEGPLPILVLSPEYTLLVAPGLALSRHERRVSVQKLHWDILLCV
jgi:hypothetical protein